jgi:hypothetical protein
MKLNKLVETLAGIEPTGFPFVSLYINAKANENGGEDYKVWLVSN